MASPGVRRPEAFTPRVVLVQRGAAGKSDGDMNAGSALRRAGSVVNMADGAHESEQPVPGVAIERTPDGSLSRCPPNPTNRGRHSSRPRASTRCGESALTRNLASGGAPTVFDGRSRDRRPQAAGRTWRPRGMRCLRRRLHRRRRRQELARSRVRATRDESRLRYEAVDGRGSPSRAWRTPHRRRVTVREACSRRGRLFRE